MSLSSIENTPLFTHEEFVFKAQHKPPVRRSRLADEDIDAKYVRENVKIVKMAMRYPLPDIVGMIETGDYKLNTEWRRRHQWNRVTQSRLIESLIVNVPVSPIILYQGELGKYEVIDGIQRMTAIYEFYKGQLILKGLEEWPELDGHTYFQLPLHIKKDFDRSYLPALIVLPESVKSQEYAKRFKQLVFKFVLHRHNSGDVEIKAQKYRHVIYNGPLNNLCLKQARNPYLCKTWNIPEPTPEEFASIKAVPEVLFHNDAYRNMDDIDLVLRFFAFRQRHKHPEESPENYLDNFLNYGNRLPKDVLNQLEELFNQTIKLVYDVFGDKSFCLWVFKDGTARPSKAVYDSMMYVFSQHLEDAETLLQHRHEFQTRMRTFYEKNFEHFETQSLTDMSIMTKRNKLIEEFVTSIIGSKYEK